MFKWTGTEALRKEEMGSLSSEMEDKVLLLGLVRIPFSNQHQIFEALEGGG